MGDFNNVLNTDERIGSKVIVAETKEFKQCVDTCCLQELKSTGAFYTWNNKRSGEDRVMSRIDRVLVNFDWMSMIPTSTVHYMTEGLYDHSPAIISWDNRKQMVNRHFKYFNMWSMDPDFKGKVAESWSTGINGTKMYQIVGKLNRLKRVLKQLKRTKFSNIEGKAEQAKKDLEECQQHIYRRYKEASDQFLGQKSKVQWLKQGDKNNKYFHSYIKARINANKILPIKDSKGNKVTNVEGITGAFVEFYSNLLGSTTDKRDHVCSPLVREGKVVTEEQRQMLTEDFTEKEVKQALWQIDGEKAPGPDGCGSKFFKDSWEITGKALKEAALEFFESGKIAENN
ncbi:PREDICTED: uncharacterized protein LOC109205460 [Nicotiana attenuata]|uniref:uncharacterized protein LOC109205460 n=1 Tax=Nicotiana attenuata TaxID=49451 RepID=UPI0009057644|nr:PREDICTED: uncharacterized protein LOC109205460 [Nicotiana attenuata]